MNNEYLLKNSLAERFVTNTELFSIGFFTFFRYSSRDRVDYRDLNAGPQVRIMIDEKR
jgi:hypothetical protein